MSQWLARLLSRMQRPRLVLRTFARGHGDTKPCPEDAGTVDDDPKTIVIPMCQHAAIVGMDFYQVYAAFTRERLQFQSAITRGQLLEPQEIADALACPLGVWLRFVDYPGRRDLIDLLRELYRDWHTEASAIAHLSVAGAHGHANRAMRLGKFSALSRRITSTLTDLWQDAYDSRIAA